MNGKKRGRERNTRVTSRTAKASTESQPRRRSRAKPPSRQPSKQKDISAMLFTEVTPEMLQKTAWKKSVMPKSQVIEKSEQHTSDSEE